MVPFPSTNPIARNAVSESARTTVARAMNPAAADGVAVTVPVYVVPAGEHVLTFWQGDADVVRRYVLRVVVE